MISTKKTADGQTDSLSLVKFHFCLNLYRSSQLTNLKKWTDGQTDSQPLCHYFLFLKRKDEVAERKAKVNRVHNILKFPQHFSLPCMYI